MATAARRKKAQGLGYRHRIAADNLKRNHQDGTPCSWCGRPMYKDRTRNWDYNADGGRDSGKLHAHHSKMSRAEAIRLGLPISPPDELLHGACNIQLGDGGNQHLAHAGRGSAPLVTNLYMPWPWSTDVT
ncbi:hypothetical protein DSM43518_02036 [Mycobacterium marinum]|uniref:hypothetical protein n=1 Tax=Mycobacterium marinum TaxID=1781 RepID=UPI000EEED291|nr:hypothetical protein [Mycobacterium marinum]RFZ11196.1 hypothetical protein DSM43518_02036 [Mycobacterium marinum]